LAESTSETKLIQDYEAIRQREYELITGLLDVLPKIEKLGEQRVGQVRDALFHADHPFLMVFVGPFNSGKSSIINALLGTDILKSGPTPTTDRITLLRYGDAPQQMNSAGEADTVFHPVATLKRVSFVDTPGLESTLQEHEDITRKFLHRCDVVMLVMLATRAMTQSNLNYLQTFKEFGKKVIILINQADLLAPDEQATVREYVAQHSKDKLGFTPEVWLTSAKQGLDAVREDGSRDATLWEQSGLGQVEAYIEKSLGDADRLRQKLQTPLQIVQNVHQAALTAVRENQATFDSYRAINDNINRQLEAQKREQENIVRDTIKEVEYRFAAAADRSATALREIFQFSKALSSLGAGLAELTGIVRLFRRADTPSPIKLTYEKFRVFEPLKELPTIVDKLPARIEGQDMQDVDDLVKYGQREVASLPPSMRDKIIGNIQAPVKYDRTAFQDVRPDLDEIEKQAQILETENVESARRNTLLYLAVWELILIVLMIALFNVWGALNNNETNTPVSFVLFVVLLIAAMLGFVALPLRGRAIATSYANRLFKLRSQYVELIHKAADKHVEYGMKLRRDAIAPLTRLVDAQTSIHDEQLKKLKNSEQMIARIEGDLNAFGKRRFLGLTM
jgi:ribosome biogenesis GTPase A